MTLTRDERIRVKMKHNKHLSSLYEDKEYHCDYCGRTFWMYVRDKGSVQCECGACLPR
jgi:hypothetical protein